MNLLCFSDTGQLKVLALQGFVLLTPLANELGLFEVSLNILLEVNDPTAKLELLQRGRVYSFSNCTNKLLDSDDWANLLFNRIKNRGIRIDSEDVVNVMYNDDRQTANFRLSNSMKLDIHPPLGMESDNIESEIQYIPFSHIVLSDLGMGLRIARVNYQFNYGIVKTKYQRLFQVMGPNRICQQLETDILAIDPSKPENENVKYKDQFYDIYHRANNQRQDFTLDIFDIFILSDPETPGALEDGQKYEHQPVFAFPWPLASDEEELSLVYTFTPDKEDLDFKIRIRTEIRPRTLVPSIEGG